MSTSLTATSDTSQTTAASPSDSPTISTTTAATTTMASTTPTTPSSTTSAPSSATTPSATTGTGTGTTPTMSEASNTISSTSDPPSSPPNDSTSSSRSSSTTQSQTLTSTSTTQPPTSTTSTTSTSTSTSTSTTPTSTSTSTTPTSTTESTSTSSTDSSTGRSQTPTQATVTNETTHTNEVVTTLESTVFVTTTNSAGSTFTSAPSEVTSLLTSTNSNGGIVTVTQIGVNPTLSPNNDNDDGSSFFHNTGAVAGVFVLVGLALASILLWILFAVRRRRRTRRLEHDTAVNATLAAAGFHRAPLEDEDDDHGATGKMRYGSPEMAQHSPRSSIPTIPTTGRTSAYLNDVNIESGFNPYAEMGAYGPPQTPLLISNARNGSDQRISHSASHSAGSYEPLLASYYNAQNETSRGPTPPLRNPQRNADKSPVLAQSGLPGERSSAASSYSTQDTGDDRLDPDLRRRMKDDNDAEKGDLRDDEDYSRPVLGVRNIPDGVSVLSQ